MAPPARILAPPDGDPLTERLVGITSDGRPAYLMRARVAVVFVQAATQRMRDLEVAAKAAARISEELIALGSVIRSLLKADAPSVVDDDMRRALLAKLEAVEAAIDDAEEVADGDLATARLEMSGGTLDWEARILGYGPESQ